jgi:hypothetical protein
MAKNKMKSLARMKDASKGTIHHIEIHPALNAKGGPAFVTRVHRNRPAAQQAAMDKGGPYMAEPQPEEYAHEDQPGMVDHVDALTGGNPAADEPDGDEAPPQAA